MRHHQRAIHSPPTAWRPVSTTADSLLVMSLPPPPPSGTTKAECLVYWQRPLGADASVRRLTVQVLRQRQSRSAKITTVGRTTTTSTTIVPNCWALPLTLSQLPFEIRKDCAAAAAAQNAVLQTLQIVGSHSLMFESDGTDVWEWICQCLQQELFVSNNNSIRNIHFVSDCGDKDCAVLLRAYYKASIQDLRNAATVEAKTTLISNQSLVVSIDGMNSSSSSSTVPCGAREGAIDPLVRTGGNYTQTFQALRFLQLRELRLEYGAVLTRKDIDCLHVVTMAATSSNSLLQRVAVHGTTLLLADWSAYARLIQWAESASHVAVTIANCAVLETEHHHLEMEQREAQLLLWPARLAFVNWNATLQTWRRALLLHRYRTGHHRTSHDHEYRLVLDSVVTILRDWYRSSLDVVHPMGTATIGGRATTPCIAVESGSGSTISMSSDKTTTTTTGTEPIAQFHDGASSGTARGAQSERSLNLASVLRAQGQTCTAATSVGP
jgi:hypothetical protein